MSEFTKCDSGPQCRNVHEGATGLLLSASVLARNACQVPAKDVAQWQEECQNLQNAVTEQEDRPSVSWIEAGIRSRPPSERFTDESIPDPPPDSELIHNENESGKFENVLQHLDCGILLLDEAGHISFVNVQMARFLGVPRHALIGRSLPGLVSFRGLSRSYRKMILRLCKEIIQGRLRYREVIDEHGRHYLVTVTHGDDLDGDTLISVKDVTEHKLIEQSAYENDKLAVLGKIAAAIAHELRNPLTSIRGFIQLLYPHFVRLGKEEYAKIILDEIDRANDIIYEFLNSSKPSAPDKQEVCVAALLKEVCLLFESEALLQGCDIVVSATDPDLTVFVDDKQMKQALLNIVKNALDAIAVSNKPGRGLIRISAQKSERHVIISVQDNGAGMDYATMTRLFDPFFTTKPDGTGLGLSVCYRIIKNHGGTIDVDSTVGKGTTFSIFLPLC
mgnify:FL=1